MPVKLKEATGKLEKGGGHKYHARIIEGDKWGSSGYYSRQVLESDGPTAWPAGTQIYLDHPTPTEDLERPARSVKDLAGKIISTPAYESDGLYADVEFYPHYAGIIESMWEDVGLSIRASATVEQGEADGRRGYIIQSIENGLSVDVVTKAGAGGKLVSLLESARETAPASIEEATVNNTRNWLSDAVRDANPGGWAWVRDFDESSVYYERDTDGPDGRITERLFQQGYTLDGNSATLTGEPVEVKAETIYTPVTQQTAEESAKDSPSSTAGVTEKKEAATMATTTIEESEYATLKENASRATTLETENKDLKAENTTLREAQVKSDAEKIVNEAFGDIEAPATKTNLVEAAKITEDGKLDKAALKAKAEESAAEWKVAHGEGAVRGVGNSGTVTESQDVADGDILTALKGGK